jgi:hypothetical protein
MRIVCFCVGLIIAGCAGNPTGSPPPTTIAPTQVASTASATAPATSAPPATPAQKLAEARKLGYTIVNENGETLYCRKEPRVGSHLITDTTCLTEAQIEDLRRRTQEAMRTFQYQMPPPQGK